jgi:NTE family protein
MKKVVFSLLLLLVSLSNAHSQKVGLVLSGGGAKGMTHIGIIRALEENGIPIDYITGTSMGAIIGSLYAMGYSPDDMEALLRSPDFKRWYTGAVEPAYQYYFKKSLPTPEFFNVRFSLTDSLRVRPQLFPTNLVNPVQMNLAFVQLFGEATAACKGNFDQLFVPFRCVASDVYNKRQLVLGKGDLGDAVRASMSFPFVFRPIEIDSVLAYDGGIYNNFPTDVMRDDFHPDVIIGSVVSGNPSKPNVNSLMSQLENMIMQKTDYAIPDSVGLVMTFRYEDVNLLDFDRLKDLEEIGYKRTYRMMDSIKARITRRISPDSVQARRETFKKRMPKMLFHDIYIEGANPSQQAYIRKEFHGDENDVFTYEELKKGYFRLISDNMISEIVPHAVYRPETGYYDLHLKVKMEKNFTLNVGGNLSTTSSNRIYLGLDYQNLNYYSKEIKIDGQLGKNYDNLQLMGRLDLPTRVPISFRFIASLSSFEYYQKNNLFSSHNTPSLYSKDERFMKLMISLPFMSNRKAEFGVGLATLKDYYFQSNTINIETDRYDRSKYDLVGGSVAFLGSTLNARQFATQGSSEKLVAQIFSGYERYRPGTSGQTVSSSEKHYHAWLQISYQKQAYHQMAPHFVLGWMVKALYSSQNFSTNYAATMMHAGEFSPTPFSQLAYNTAFRANQFVAGGIRPIIPLNDMFHIRTEFYAFMPIFPIMQSDRKEAYYGKAFSKIEYMGEASIVCRLPFGAVSAYVNHYSSPRKAWNMGISIGWQLFNYRFIE